MPEGTTVTGRMTTGTPSHGGRSNPVVGGIKRTGIYEHHGTPATTTATVETAPKFFLRPDEAAHFLGVSKRTLSNLQKQRAIPYSKLGRVVVFKRQDLIASVERFRVNAIGELPRQRKRRATHIEEPTP